MCGLSENFIQSPEISIHERLVAYFRDIHNERKTLKLKGCIILTFDLPMVCRIMKQIDLITPTNLETTRINFGSDDTMYRVIY